MRQNKGTQGQGRGFGFRRFRRDPEKGGFFEEAESSAKGGTPRRIRTFPGGGGGGGEGFGDRERLEEEGGRVGGRGNWEGGWV